MPANTALVVTGLNFDTIETNLKNFLRSKPEFADYDFADSAIGTLISLLAYNTYMNSFYVNMAASESFLDSAQFFDSVVSHSKKLGYVPTSAIGAAANVRVSFTTAVANSSRPTLTINKNTKFTTSINGVSYTFVTPRSYTVSGNSTNGFRQDIQLVEGLPLTHRFTYSSSNTEFVLPNTLIDTRSITVSITSGANTDTYVVASNLMGINSSSQVFFVEADRDRKYKIVFGDGVLGKRPPFNSLVAVNYRVCNGLKGNGANNFTAVGTIGGESNFTLNVLERATGGAEQESINSIKFNAPKNYEIQNRSVIDTDYQRIILRDNPDLEAVNVWGGQDNDPPIYGKVFVSVKPSQGTLISSTRKEQIKTNIKTYNIQAIDVEMVDPTILYIVPTVKIIYDPKLTTKTASELTTLVANRIITYETNNFSRFDSKFWYSRFLNYLDNADNGIVSSSATIDLQKRFRPSTSAKNTYTFRFNNRIQSLGDDDSITENVGFGWLTSTSFTYKGFTSFFEDNGFGLVRIYYKDAALGRLGRIYTNTTAGEIDYSSGTLILRNFLPTAYSGDELKLNVRPVNQNIESVKNQLLFFSDATVSVYRIGQSMPDATATSIATAGQSTTVNETGLSILTTF